MRKLYYAFFGKKSCTLTRLLISTSIGLLFLVGLSNKALSQSISVTSVTTTPVCAGSIVTITFNVTNGIGAANYFTNSTNYEVFFSDASGANFTASGGTFNITAS